jgi:hypothetical protein
MQKDGERWGQVRSGYRRKELTAFWDSGLFCMAVPITQSVCFMIFVEDFEDFRSSCSCFHIFIFWFVRSSRSGYQHRSYVRNKSIIDVDGCSRFALSISCTSYPNMHTVSTLLRYGLELTLPSPNSPVPAFSSLSALLILRPRPHPHLRLPPLPHRWR